MAPKRKALSSVDDSVAKSLRSTTGLDNGSDDMATKKAEMKSKMERLTRETIILKQEVMELKDTIANVVRQNQTILNLIGEQQVMISGIFKVETKPHCMYTAKFPLQTQEDLDAIEAEINDTNREKLVSSVQSLITPGGLRNLSAILSLDICLDYNIEGIHNKKRLQNYPKLLDILFRATMKSGWTHKMFIDDLRKGLKFVKNRHFKSLCMLRKKEREESANTTADISVTNEATYDDDDEEFPESKNYVVM